jgi:hypothetical protein
MLVTFSRIIKSLFPFSLESLPVTVKILVTMERTEAAAILPTGVSSSSSPPRPPFFEIGSHKIFARADFKPQSS